MSTDTTFILRSLTASIKAKHILADAGIGATSVKITSDTENGCQHGISVQTKYAERALNLMKQSGIYPINTVKIV